MIWKIGDIAPHMRATLGAVPIRRIQQLVLDFAQGYADVGLSAAENVDKDISEEANLSVKAHKLYAVRHKANHADTPDTPAFHNV